MTFPAATFVAVAPPPEGLALAFTSARRRRNSKAAVSAFGGAVAIVSALSCLAPPGQSLVQEPTPPAHGGAVPGLLDAPRHGAPTPVVRTTTPTASVLHRVPSATHPLGVTRHVFAKKAPAATPADACVGKSLLICVDVTAPTPGGPTARARACPVAATVTVEYEAPPVGPTRLSASRTVSVGTCST
jgi:hypothetical protein